jgi:putative SOS response-associated peptidase YedK
MCNLYSLTKGQAAIRELARAMRDTTGNLPAMPGVFPDYAAPIVRTGANGVRELVTARWGVLSVFRTSCVADKHLAIRSCIR